MSVKHYGHILTLQPPLVGVSALILYTVCLCVNPKHLMRRRPPQSGTSVSLTAASWMFTPQGCFSVSVRVRRWSSLTLLQVAITSTASSYCNEAEKDPLRFSFQLICYWLSHKRGRPLCSCSVDICDDLVKLGGGHPGQNRADTSG